MIKISAEELRAYCMCPELYNLKYVEKKTPDRDRSSPHFDGHSHIVLKASKAIENLTSFYFHRLMDNRQVQFGTLYKRWEKLWWDGVTGKEIRDMIVPVGRTGLVRVNTALISNLPRFHKTFHKPFRPLVVNKDISITSSDTFLYDKIQLAYKRNENTIRIVKFLPYQRSIYLPDKDLSLIIQATSWAKEYDIANIEMAHYSMLAIQSHDPWTVTTLERKHINGLDKILNAFSDKIQINDNINCAGCEYRCKKK